MNELFNWPGVFFDEGDGGGAGGGSGSPAPGAGGGSGSPTPTDADEAEFAGLPPKTIAEIRRLRNENATTRVRATEAEKKLKAKEDAELSEAEKIANKIKDLERVNSELAKKAADANKAEVLRDAGCKHPTLLIGLLSDDATTDKGKATDAIKALKQSYPDLFGTVVRPTGNGNGGAGTGGGQEPSDNSMNAQIRRAAGRG